MKRKYAPASLCELPGQAKKTGPKTNMTSLYRHTGDFRWKGVKDQPYKTEGGKWPEVVRRVLVGAQGESARFHVRYFEIAPGGKSSLETHRHEHVVICVRGEGQVLAGRSKKRLGFMDTIYISPDTLHQLSNPFEEPFGFLCIVNARRDRPRVKA
ncbi:MAG: cupin domain-containing protein [Nitrospirae bacterium]|nr:MAG: cupin domain-containing protein [Nitrospirota bacterium]